MKITDEMMNMRCLEGMGQVVRNSRNITRAQKDEYLERIAMWKAWLEVLEVDNLAEVMPALKVYKALGAFKGSEAK